jgi:cytoskeleton protein RodZ
MEEKVATGTFGDHLKREREMRGVSLDEISAATRIATRFLTAIENEQWNLLPGGVFNRGFVRAVARYLGLDEENTVAEYAAAAGDRPTVPVWTGSPPTVTPDHPWLAWILAAVVVAVIATGGWFAMRRILRLRASGRAAQVAATSATPAPGQPGLPETTKVVPVSAEPAPTRAQVAPASPRGGDTPPAPVAGSTSAASAPPFLLKVEAEKTTRVTVDADAQRVYDGTMKAGENRVFTVRDRIEVSAGDAGALQLELNGKRLAPIGQAGHEGKATLTRESLKGTAGGGN